MDLDRDGVEARSVKLCAIGDVALSGAVATAIRTDGPGTALDGLRGVLAGADCVFANLESPFVPAETPADGWDRAALVAGLDLAPALAGIDVCNLAANHVLDGGARGLEATRAVLDRLGIAHVGAGTSRAEAWAPRIVERGGLRLGFLAWQEDCTYTVGASAPGPALIDPPAMRAAVADLAAQVDAVVVSLHADLEFVETPAPWRRDLAHDLIAAGARLVLGTHPHVPQGVEACGRGLIAHSLGNAVFDVAHPYMRANGPDTAWSFVLEVDLDGDGVRSWRQHPFAIGDRGCGILMAGSAADRAAAELDRRNRLLADPAVLRANWRRLCLVRLQGLIDAVAGLRAEDVIEHHAWILGRVHEHRRWFDEVAAMADEAYARRPLVRREDRRPSWATEAALAIRSPGWP